MSLEIVINAREEEEQVAILENKRLVEFFVEDDKKHVVAGNVYKGVVKNVLPGIEAAFVDIGVGQNAFLYLSGIYPDEEMFSEAVETPLDEEFDLGLSEILQAGQEILVQVVKEAAGTKGATLSSNITLPGRHLVLMPTSKHIGVSRRITESEERERLEEMMRELAPPKMGLIARTNARGKSIAYFKNELEGILTKWKKIKRLIRSASPASLVYKELPLTLRVVRDIFTEGGDKILIDSPIYYKKILGLLDDFGLGHLKSCVSLYEGDDGIFEALNVKKEITSALTRKIWLKCGGYIIIDELEALVAIDVNSGRYTGSKNLEKTILKVNLEAAREVAKQLRLRNLGGIIIVDFIDMKNEDSKKKLMATLEKELSRDRVKCNILSLTQLGLVEITRKRSSSSLDGILRQECPMCQGEGRVLKEIL